MEQMMQFLSPQRQCSEGPRDSQYGLFPLSAAMVSRQRLPLGLWHGVQRLPAALPDSAGGRDGFSGFPVELLCVFRFKSLAPAPH